MRGFQTLTRHEDDVIVREALAADGVLEDGLGGEAVGSVLLDDRSLVARVQRQGKIHPPLPCLSFANAFPAASCGLRSTIPD